MELLDVVLGRDQHPAAGAVVLEGTEVPPGSLVAGVPGKVVRQLGEEALAAIRANAVSYTDRLDQHRAARPVT